MTPEEIQKLFREVKEHQAEIDRRMAIIEAVLPCEHPEARQVIIAAAEIWGIQPIQISHPRTNRDNWITAQARRAAIVVITTLYPEIKQHEIVELCGRTSPAYRHHAIETCRDDPNPDFIERFRKLKERFKIA